MKHIAIKYTPRLAKVRITIVAFAIISFSCSQAEFLRPELAAQPPLNVSPKLGVIDRSYVAIMKSPASKNEIVFSIRAGEIVEIVERSEAQSSFNGDMGYWYKIRFNAGDGWVFSKDLVTCSDQNQAKYVSQRIKESVFY